MALKLALVLVLVAVAVSSAGAALAGDHERYEEDVAIIALADGSVMFRTEATFRVSPCAFHNGSAHETGRCEAGNDCASSIAPLPLRRAMQASGATSFGLRMAQGRWKQGLWGRYPHSGIAPIPGAELEASWPSDAANTADHALPSPPAALQARFKTLATALGSMFCSSLSILGGTHTIADHALLASPRRARAAASVQLTTLRGLLQREAVCTENLTPLQSLLPCGRLAGVFAKLNSKAMFQGARGHASLLVFPSFLCFALLCC